MKENGKKVMNMVEEYMFGMKENGKVIDMKESGKKVLD